METLVLNNTQLASEVTVAYGFENGPKHKKATEAEKKANPDAKGQAYRTLIFDGIGFTVSEEVYQDWKNGKLASMKLIKDKRDVTKETTNPESGEITKTTESKTSFAYSGSLTKVAALSNKQFDVKMKQLDVIASIDIAAMTPEQVQSLMTSEI